MKRRGKPLKRSQVLSAYKLARWEKTHVNAYLDELDTLGIVIYRELKGKSYIEVITDPEDDLGIVNGGRWRIWLDHHLDLLPQVGYLLSWVKDWHTADEELPF